MTRARRRSMTAVASGLLALAIALLCALPFATSPTAASDRSSADGMSMANVSTQFVSLTVVVGDTPAPESGVSSPALLGGMCNGVCATHSAATCALVVVLTVISLLGLLLSRRRDTYLGVTARLQARPRPVQTERQRPPRWTVLTLTDLCLLRV